MDTLKFWLSILLASFGLCVSHHQASAQWSPDKIVQINGVLMTADSLRSVPYATIQVKGSERGTYSSESGVFTLVALKGEKLIISSVGYRPIEVTIPNDVVNKYYSMIQLMVQDTFFLPETIIKPLPTPGEFDYAFKYWDIPDDLFEQARKNTSSQQRRILEQTIAKDGRENQSAFQRQQKYDAMYYGTNLRPQNIGSPAAWMQFFEAWKRGDFKRRKY